VAAAVGCAELQSTRPQTLAYALTDSPLGLLAWILDLEWAADDDPGGHETPVAWDAILTDVTIYWLTRTAGSSARLYKEHGSLFSDIGFNPLPTAVTVFRATGRCGAGRAPPARRPVYGIRSRRPLRLAPGPRSADRRHPRLRPPARR
jgi:hypothetical protein